MTTDQNIQIKEWGRVGDEIINLYTVANTNGIKVSIANFGAAVQSIIVPDNGGKPVDIVLGYDSLAGYENDDYYIGTVVGRYANRIAGGKVNIEGQDYQLTVKEGGFHHHGGKIGFNKKVWNAKIITDRNSRSIQLTCLSKDGEEGFPGDLETTVTYTLNSLNQFIVDYLAITNKPTLINLTQHSYFNLDGHGSILGHKLMMPLEYYLPVNQMQVPKGAQEKVAGTPFDFTSSKPIGRDIGEKNEQLELSFGYDHSWVVKPGKSDELILAAKVAGQRSGIQMNVYTTEPAIHLYTGNFLDGTMGKNNIPNSYREGVCLETQNYPDSPNHPNFPGAILKPGEVFTSRTIFEFV